MDVPFVHAGLEQGAVHLQFLYGPPSGTMLAQVVRLRPFDHHPVSFIPRQFEQEFEPPPLAVIAPILSVPPHLGKLPLPRLHHPVLESEAARHFPRMAQFARGQERRRRRDRQGRYPGLGGRRHQQGGIGAPPKRR